MARGGKGPVARIAAVRLFQRSVGSEPRLAAALLAFSPRVAVAGPGLCRVDAGEWVRRGGEEACARSLLRAAGRAGFRVGVGVADVAVAADVAAALAVDAPVRIPPREARSFLAPLPLYLLPVSASLRETFRALGIRRIGEVAELGPAELEGRFGLEGLRVSRWARGEDDRIFFPPPPEDLPEARLELNGPLTGVEPLLFVLRHLLGRICADLSERGMCAARLALELELEEGEPVEISVVPARPTAREVLLFDLCRSVLERETGRRGADGGVTAATLRVRRCAPAGVRQGNLFVRGWRDPLEASTALARLRARLGDGGVVRPAPEDGHRPEAKNRWLPVEPDGEQAPGGGKESGEAEASEGSDAEALASLLYLLPRPLPIGARPDSGPPAEVWDDAAGRRKVIAAEGPERLSGDWWGTPYRREYYRLCTARGELLWVFRERNPGEEKARWWLHGWWD